jgi:hypothetical protein
MLYLARSLTIAVLCSLYGVGLVAATPMDGHRHENTLRRLKVGQSGSIEHGPSGFNSVRASVGPSLGIEEASTARASNFLLNRKPSSKSRGGEQGSRRKGGQSSTTHEQDFGTQVFTQNQSLHGMQQHDIHSQYSQNPSIHPENSFGQLQIPLGGNFDQSFPTFTGWDNPQLFSTSEEGTSHTGGPDDHSRASSGSYWAHQERDDNYSSQYPDHAFATSQFGIPDPNDVPSLDYDRNELFQPYDHVTPQSQHFDANQWDSSSENYDTVFSSSNPSVQYSDDPATYSFDYTQSSRSMGLPSTASRDTFQQLTAKKEYQKSYRAKYSNLYPQGNTPILPPDRYILPRRDIDPETGYPVQWRQIVLEKLTQIRPFDSKKLQPRLKNMGTKTIVMLLGSTQAEVEEGARQYQLQSYMHRYAPTQHSWMDAFSDSFTKIEVIRRLAETTLQEPNALRDHFLSANVHYSVAQLILNAQYAEDIWSIAEEHDLILPYVGVKPNGETIRDWQKGLTEVQKDALIQRMLDAPYEILRDRKACSAQLRKPKLKPGFSLEMLKVEDDEFVMMLGTLIEKRTIGPLPRYWDIVRDRFTRKLRY